MSIGRSDDPSWSILFPRSWPAPSGSGPSVRETLLLAGLILTFLAVAGGLEAAASTPYPVTFIAAVILVFALLCVNHLEAAFLLILAATPFSTERLVPGTGSALQVPTEPMLFLALAAWGARSLVRGNRTFAQPGLTGALLLALGTIVLSVITSASRVESLKAAVNATWYGLYGMFILNQFADRGRLKLLAWAWLVPGVVLSLYSMGNVLVGHYEPLRGFWWAMPFFPEHGSFAANLSFVCALAFALALELPGALKLLFAAVALLTGAQVILSLTRGAWMGLAGLGLFLVVVSGRRLLRFGNLVIVLIGLLGIVGFIGVTGASKRIERQSQSFTDPTNVSNLERVNRWIAAYRMFQSAPVTGIGFGAYSDVYLNYRRVSLSTEQSTQRMGVHSEYLKVLAEAGLVGAAAAALVFFFVVRLAWRAIRRTRDPFLRALAVGVTGGLVTYGVHATVNNFMNYDKLAIPVWTAAGVLGAIDTLTRE